jgi:hypothetical protein
MPQHGLKPICKRWRKSEIEGLDPQGTSGASNTIWKWRSNWTRTVTKQAERLMGKLKEITRNVVGGAKEVVAEVIGDA